MIQIAKEHNKTAENLSENKLIAFQTLLESWKQLFENPPSVPFDFAVNGKAQLTLGDVVICDISQITEEGASFDHEHLYLNTWQAGCFYRIKIIWSFDETVHVDEVALVLYQANR